MERLTKRIESFVYYTQGKYTDTIPAEMTKADIRNVLSKLAEYEDAEEQGLLIRLPCKVGDVVYTNMRASGWYKREKNKPYKANVAFIGINGKDNFMNVVFENDNVLQFLLSDIGKTVFLTREEAEAALERIG